MAVAEKDRFHFIDQFRGLVGVMMALGHSNHFFNTVWLSFKDYDPFFGSWDQFALRYMGYLCAPGFLMMNGAMVYWIFRRFRMKGAPDRAAYSSIIQRGLFLILVQMVWVNSSWSCFGRFRPDHFGIIATIGSSMVLLTLIISWRWWARLLVAATIFAVHPLLLRIPYDLDSWTHYPMQLFITSGKFNLYPVLPWFALATVGSVMAHFWFERWRQPGERAAKTILIGVLLILAAWAVRMLRGYGNIFPFDGFFSWSFFLVQKYPPGLAHQLWFSGAVTLMVGLFAGIGLYSPILKPLALVGRVPLFFYAVHIPLLAFVTKRLHFFDREGAVLESLIGWVALLAVMVPLAIWFGRVKQRNRSWLIRMI